MITTTFQAYNLQPRSDVIGQFMVSFSAWQQFYDSDLRFAQNRFPPERIALGYERDVPRTTDSELFSISFLVSPLVYIADLVISFSKSPREKLGESSFAFNLPIDFMSTSYSSTLII